MTWTAEQLRALADDGADLAAAAHSATLAQQLNLDAGPALNRVALAGRRIAEIVVPQDLKYTP